MKCQIIYATEYEEFFYEEDDMPVSEGQPIGVEVDLGDSVELLLLEGLYHLIHEEG
jgi:hypothetical protein